MDTRKKIYRLTDIKFPWLLAATMLAFVAALCFNRLYPDAFARIETVVYCAIFFIALFWSMANYVSHLKINPLYARHDSIEAFIQALAMGKEEKAEFSQYLNDFIKDLKANGSSHEEAVQTAISHFQVKEFTASGGSLFEKPPHLYLVGYASVFLGLALVIQCVDLLALLPFFFSAVCFMLTLFGAAFIGLFFVYKLMDVFITKKGVGRHD